MKGAHSQWAVGARAAAGRMVQPMMTADAATLASDLLPIPARHNLDGRAGVAASWTTHDLLALDWDRGREHQGTQQTMNRALASVLRALGYRLQPFGTGGASLVTNSRRSTPATMPRSSASRKQR